MMLIGWPWRIIGRNMTERPVTLDAVTIYFHYMVPEDVVYRHPTLKDSWLMRDKASLKRMAAKLNVTIEGL